MTSFYLWILATIPEEYQVANCQILVKITPRLIEGFLLYLSQTLPGGASGISPQMIYDLGGVLAKEQVIFVFPDNYTGDGSTIFTIAGKLPTRPSVSVPPLIKNTPVPVFSEYFKFLFKGNYLVWGVSGFVLSEIWFIDQLYIERQHLLAKNPELPPLGINVSDYITGDGPFFANKETEELALKLLVSLGKSLTVGIAFGCLSYGLSLIGS